MGGGEGTKKQTWRRVGGGVGSQPLMTCYDNEVRLSLHLPPSFLRGGFFFVAVC